MDIETKVLTGGMVVWVAGAMISLGIVGLIVWALVKHLTN